MKKYSELTVIIPTKDESDTLVSLLDCLRKQSFKNFDIIVADNSSSSVVKDICCIHGITCVCGGLPGIASNNGVKHASSKYFLFLDADMYICDTFIADALKALKNLQADCLSFGFYAVTSSSLIQILHSVVKYYYFVTTKLGFPHGIGGAILVKRKIHHLVNGFDESITVLEDFDYCKRISKKYKYLFILSPSVGLNIRRILKEGALYLGCKYLLMDMHRIFFGEIRKIKYFDD
jgi:glycosyltransferase involved in cell wall biosynthesis